MGACRPGVLLLALVGAFGVGGCGDGGASPPPGGFDAGRTDGGSSDAASGTDGALADGGPGGDAAVDAGAPTCALSPATDLIDLATDLAGKGRVLSMAPGPDGVLVLWAANDGTSPDVWSRYVPSSGAVPAAVQVTDDFYLSRSPAVARVGGAYLAAWVDNSPVGSPPAARYEIHARPLDASGAPTGTAVTVTDNAATEDALALAPFGSGALLAWVETDPMTSEQALRTLPLGADGAPSGTVQTIRSGVPLARPALASDGGTTVLAWVEGSRVAVQVLDASGAASGTLQYADAQMNAAGTADVAFATGATTEATGGAVVYAVNVSTRREARWRRLDASALVAGTERLATSPGTRAADPSVAPFRGGFVTSLRVLEAASVTGPLVRLVFSDNAGAIVGSVDVADTVADGARTTVRVGLDGHLLVGWSEQGVTTTALRVARLRCGT